eukprot:PhM_4_TR8406/c6_g1_i1/m.59037
MGRLCYSYSCCSYLSVSYILIIYFSTLGLIGDGAADTANDCPSYERQALKDLYDSCHGFRWTQSSSLNWDKADGAVCGVWAGVTCAAVSEASNAIHVVGLSIPNNPLNCEIPTSLASLVFLQTFDVSGSALKGPFPTVVRGWHAVTQLRLSGTGIAGTLPEWLSLKTSLTDLEVSGNNLFGTIPEVYRNLKSLQVLDLSNNVFSGHMPEFLGALPQWSVKGGANVFTGPCPPPVWMNGHVDTNLQVRCPSAPPIVVAAVTPSSPPPGGFILPPSSTSALSTPSSFDALLSGGGTPTSTSSGGTSSSSYMSSSSFYNVAMLLAVVGVGVGVVWFLKNRRPAPRGYQDIGGNGDGGGGGGSGSGGLSNAFGIDMSVLRPLRMGE